jgi:hypothetical protein
VNDEATRRLFRFQKRFDHVWVEVRACQRTKMLLSGVYRPGLAIRRVRSESIPDVDDREDPRRQWNRGGGETARIPAAVPSFVMAIGDIERRPESANRRQPLVRIHRMPAHDVPFRFIERPGFLQD